MMNLPPENLPIFEDVAPEVVLPEAVVVPKLSLVDFLWNYKFKFAFGIFSAFIIVYSFIAVIGLLPESLQAAPEASAIVPLIAPSTSTTPIEQKLVIATSSAKVVTIAKKTAQKTVVKPAKRAGDDPIRVFIPKIGVDTRVSNPTTATVSVLDEYLKRGAVRYPGSAGLGGGNVFIFAHSTNWTTVVNQAYKAFNSFNKLSVGDEISVYSLDRVYVYEVERVHLASAQDVYVDLSKNKNMLTLSTCNTFGQKAERYVVEAKFISSALLTENEI